MATVKEEMLELIGDMFDEAALDGKDAQFLHVVLSAAEKFFSKEVMMPLVQALYGKVKA